METSEKRKERLRAMRLEAEGSHEDTRSDVPGYLSNPLADGNVEQEEPCAPSRFGFYTDPMAGFSADTKRCKVSDQIASNDFVRSDPGGHPMPRLPPPPLGTPMNTEVPPPPHQFQSHLSPDQRMYQQNFIPQRNPAGMVRPFAMHHGNPPEVWNGPPSYNFPTDPRGSRFPGPRFRQPGSPRLGPPGNPGYGAPGSPGYGAPGTPGYGGPGTPGYVAPGTLGYGAPGTPGYGAPGTPGYGAPGTPGYGAPGTPGYSSNTQQGRGCSVSHSQSRYSVHGGRSPSSGSGRGWGHPGSGSGRGRGRSRGGRGSHDCPFDPKHYYNASMVEEDPWKGLSPVTWQALPPLIRKEVENPFSGNKNKASISESSNRSTPQPNLAEFLAASLNETINEGPTS